MGWRGTRHVCVDLLGEIVTHKWGVELSTGMLLHNQILLRGITRNPVVVGRQHKLLIVLAGRTVMLLFDGERKGGSLW